MIPTSSVQSAWRVALLVLAMQNQGCNQQTPERQGAIALPSTASAVTSGATVTTAPVTSAPVTSGPVGGIPSRAEVSSAEGSRETVRLLEWKKQASRAKSSEDPSSVEAAGVMRPGHWDPVSNVFSPTESAFVRALAIYALEDDQGWVVVRGERELGLTSLLSDVRIGVTPTDAKGRVVATMPSGYEAPDKLELVTHDGAHFRAHLPPGSVGSRDEWSPFQKPFAAAAGQLPSPRLTVLPEGCIFVGIPTGFEQDGATLTDAAGKTHALPQSAASADYTLVVNTSRELWVSATRAGCSWEGEQPEAQLKHVVLRLHAAGSSIIHQGSGSANLRAVDNDMLIQVGNQTRLWKARTKSWQDAMRLPANIVLAPPLEPKVCVNL